MNIQEMGTATQYRLPVKVFILNNQWMGMVRQWQELTYESRYSQSYSDSLPDFVKLADAYGWKGIRIEDVSGLDAGIEEMIAHVDRAVIEGTPVEAGQEIVLIAGFPIHKMVPPNLALLHTVGH